MIVLFKTKNASFKFNQEAVKKIILENKSRYVEEAEKLAHKISHSTNSKILIPEEPNYFDHVALDLIAIGEGNVFCKKCIYNYRVMQLERISIGYGEEPIFSTIEQKKFRLRKRKPPALYGGKGFNCPSGHNLISTIIWKTF